MSTAKLYAPQLCKGHSSTSPLAGHPITKSFANVPPIPVAQAPRTAGDCETDVDEPGDKFPGEAGRGENKQACDRTHEQLSEKVAHLRACGANEIESTANDGDHEPRQDDAAKGPQQPIANQISESLKIASSMPLAMTLAVTSMLGLLKQRPVVIVKTAHSPASNRCALQRRPHCCFMLMLASTRLRNASS
jgi:hypothetical protein